MSERSDQLSYLITGRINLFRIEQSEVMSKLIRRHLVVKPMVGHRNVLTHVRANRNVEKRQLKNNKFFWVI